MKASVIIPTYNRADLLRITLNCLVGQDIGADEYEVIVIDDGSSDSTRETALSFQDKLNLIYYFQEDKGYRVALARNEGIRRSQGRVLIFLDTGMIVGTFFIRKHFESYYDPQNPEVDRKVAVIGYVYGYDGNRNSNLLRGVDYEKHHQDRIMNEVIKSGRFPDIRDPIYEELGDDFTTYPAPWTLYWTTNVSVERGVMLEIGGFDETFTSWGMEDLECAYRLYRKGTTFILSREACGIHYPHDRDDDANFKHDAVNKLKCLQKHLSLEMELFIAQRYINFNKELQQLDLQSNHQPLLYSSLLSPEDAKALEVEFACQRSIIFGCQDGLLMDVCQSEVGLEADLNLAKKAKARCSSKKVLQLVGVKTLFEPQTFDVALLAGSTQILLGSFLNQLIKEAKRIAKKVYWLKIDEQPDIVEILWHKIGDYGKGLSLHEYRWSRSTKYQDFGFILGLYPLKKVKQRVLAR